MEPTAQDKINAFMAWMEANGTPEMIAIARDLAGVGEDDFTQGPNGSYSLGRWTISWSGTTSYDDGVRHTTVKQWHVSCGGYFPERSFLTLPEAKFYVLERDAEDTV